MIDGKEIVIFDTNAYRNLVSGKSYEQVDKTVRKIKALEEANGIVALMNSIVVEELLAHVASPSDYSHEVCINALKALYLHCGNEERFFMFPDVDLLIAKVLFNVEIPGRIEQQETLGHLAFLISTEEVSKVLRKFPHQFKQVKGHVNKTEESFVEGIKQMVMAFNNSKVDDELFPDNLEKKKEVLNYINSVAFSTELGLGWIIETIQIINRLSIPLSSNLLNKAKPMYRQFVQDFCAPVELWKEVLRRHVHSNFNMSEKNRANFIWDIHLMFIVTQLTMKGSKVHLISSDKAMLSAAEKCGLSLSVYTFDEYMDYLNLSHSKGKP